MTCRTRPSRLSSADTARSIRPSPFPERWRCRGLSRRWILSLRWAAARWWSPPSTSPTLGCTFAVLGVSVAAVVGDLWSTGKAVALQEYGAEVYVGDHLGDITGARAADAWAVAVATGPISAADLAAAGADVVLEDLTRFPGWLGSYLMATVH